MLLLVMQSEFGDLLRTVRDLSGSASGTERMIAWST
jgi:hypothetical protein